MTFEIFLNDKKTKDAVTRNIQILEEAGNRVPETIRNKYPAIEWRRIIRFLHIVTHEYASI